MFSYEPKQTFKKEKYSPKLWIPARTLQVCSCSHLTGHGDLGFGRCLGSQIVRVHQTHPREHAFDYFLKETVVPEKLRNYCGTVQLLLETGNILFSIFFHSKITTESDLNHAKEITGTV